MWRNPTSIKRLIPRILWAWIAGIAVAAGSSGCAQERNWAPELQRPQRPQLQPVPKEGWRQIDKDTRRVLTENQEAIFQYTEQLETILDYYAEWRAGK